MGVVPDLTPEPHNTVAATPGPIATDNVIAPVPEQLIPGISPELNIKIMIVPGSKPFVCGFTPIRVIPGAEVRNLLDRDCEQARDTGRETVTVGRAEGRLVLAPEAVVRQYPPVQYAA